MLDFEKNKCRLCGKIFCCERCRSKHEETSHSVFPTCEICIYGNIRISKITKELLTHMKRSHWPLRCVWCKKVFISEELLESHFKCPLLINSCYSENSPLTPSFQLSEETTFESPPLIQLFQKNQQCEKNLSVMSNLATSTPMQCCKEDNNNLLQKVKTVIKTPVNSAENTKESILKKTGHTDSSSKRRVTFCERVLTDNMSSHDENQNHQYLIVETPLSGVPNGTFHTAKEEPSSLNPNESKALSNTPKLPSTKKVSAFKLDNNNDKNDEEEQQVKNKEPEENNTLWISAINISKIDKKSIVNTPTADLVDIYATPLPLECHRGKFKNMAIPNPLSKEEIIFEFGRQVQISSTPNSSMIPVKTIPTAKEIFLGQNRPSTSKAESVINEYSDISVEEKPASEKAKIPNKPSSHEMCNNKKINTSHSENSFQNKLWISVHRFVQNVTSTFQSFSAKSDNDGKNTGSNLSLKRYSTAEYDSEEEPKIKRYKYSDIKCRRTIRELPPISPMRHSKKEIHINIVNNVVNNIVNNVINVSSPNKKTFADKATQTDEWLSN